MALTYTAELQGLAVAAAGLQFRAVLQHPYVLIGLSAMFILLAASMFKLFTAASVFAANSPYAAE